MDSQALTLYSPSKDDHSQSGQSALAPITEEDLGMYRRGPFTADSAASTGPMFNPNNMAFRDYAGGTPMAHGMPLAVGPQGGMLGAPTSFGSFDPSPMSFEPTVAPAPAPRFDNHEMSQAELSAAMSALACKWMEQLQTKARHHASSAASSSSPTGPATIFLVIVPSTPGLAPVGFPPSTASNNAGTAFRQLRAAAQTRYPQGPSACGSCGRSSAPSSRMPLALQSGPGWNRSGIPSLAPTNASFAGLPHQLLMA